VTFALGVVRPADLAGLRVAVTAGGTREPIDPVRFLGNRSSGRQGVAVARAAADRGAEVVLIAAHVEATVRADAAHPRITVVPVGTASELGAAVTSAAAEADVVVMAAAVADYRPASVADRKLSKDAGPLTAIELVENEDIVAGLVRSRRPGQTVVGFAAETAEDAADLRERGVRKRRRKGVDLLAVNDVNEGHGFEQPHNALLIIGSDDAVVAEASGTKRAVADALWDAVRAARA
jgi:phosphopantothenoylcysteine decarboxylase/phosphopantothenate--cysteine ligase